jgi:tRNA 5-methylaminomethyl-2-thiouridine biosynthesis bifunctional protein
MALDWLEGQPYSSHFGDVYFSRDSGLEESRHVFLQGNRLAERFASLPAGANFCIAETGFGSGLNFLSAWQLFEQVAPQGASLDFFSVEKFPLSDDELRAALALWPELAAPAAELFMHWRRRVPGWNRWSFAGGRIRLTLALEDVAQALPQLPAGCVDAWFLDGFAPAKNPEMWCEAVLTNIARAARAGATLASYTSAGWVRRGLQQAGFAVERVPGFGHKREMVTGQKRTPSPLMGEGRGEGSTPHTALVIGGGIAGCAAAHALAQRGIRVTLIERALQLASAASGNPRGILHARFGAGDNPLHRFVLAAYGHALGLLDGVVPVDGENRAECGLLQLACKPVEQKRIARLAAQEWPEHLLQFVDAEQAGRLTGLSMQYGGLWFPAGGWVVPPVLCAQLASDTRITQRLGQEVETLEQSAAGWRASGVDAQGRAWSAEAEVVVVCCAHAAKKLAPFAHFPLIAVRGQITAVPETAASKALQAVVCGDGYCAPSGHGVHVIGATHTFEDEATELRAAEHAQNLASLAEYAPALHQALTHADRLSVGRDSSRRNGGEQGDVGINPDLQMTGRAAIRCSAPGAMPLVGEVQPGLYCSLAHGTRGLLTAGIAGEVLAAQICDSLPPLPEDILAALVPLPRVRQRG